MYHKTAGRASLAGSIYGVVVVYLLLFQSKRLFELADVLAAPFDTSGLLAFGLFIGLVVAGGVFVARLARRLGL